MMPAFESFGTSPQKTIEDIHAFTCDSWDVALKSANAVSKGLDETIRSANNLAQESMARAVSAGKVLLGARTPREIMDLHAEFLKDSFDHLVACTGKMSEISARLTREAIEPVAEHTNSALGKIWHKRAA